MAKTLVWLASYPKSGNTWLRALLANYLLNAATPAPINKLFNLTFGDAVAIHYARIAKKPHLLMNETEVMATREAYLRALARNGAAVNLIKSHNVNARRQGRTLIPPGLTKFAVYMVRNPLDLLVSYADHYGTTPAEAVEALSSEHNRVEPGPRAVTQYLGDWSGHVRGWTRAAGFPVMVVRYEDLLDDPRPVIAPIVERLGLPLDAERLDRAAAFSSFEQLRGQEEARGFIERSPSQARFFRAGVRDQWRDELPAALAETFVARHGATMRKHGYL